MVIILPSPGTTIPNNDIYETLDPAFFQIRCLNLDPGKYEDPIYGSIRVLSLQDKPEYEALSYVWGKEKALSPIDISGVEVPLTSNLETALLHLRDEEETRCLWIDAICINQDDLREKAEQVKLMGLIYSKATKVIAWLGTVDESFSCVELFLQELDIRKRQSVSLEDLNISIRQMADGNNSQRDNYDFDRALRLQKRPTHVLRCLTLLFSQPYWERVWIIQEISKAARVQVLFGAYNASLGPLLLAARHLKELPARTLVLLKAINRFRAQEQGYGGLSPNARMSLYDALITSRYSLATDARDKVYALLGLTTDGSNLVSLPTYKSTTEEVFHNVTLAILYSHEQSNIVLLANWVSLHQTDDFARRWCVDWTNIGYYLPPWLSRVSNISMRVTNLRGDFNGDMYTAGRKIATIVDIEASSRRSSRDSSSIRFAPPSLAKSVLERIVTDMSQRLAIKARYAIQPDHIEVIDAFVDLIRGVENLDPLAPHHSDAVKDVLERIRHLRIQERTVLEWADSYAEQRGSLDKESGTARRVSTQAVSGSGPPSGRAAVDTKSKNRRSWTRPPQNSRRPSELKVTKGKMSNSPRTIKTSDTGRKGSADASKPTPTSSVAIRFWEEKIASLETMPEFKLRFAVAKLPDEHIILVHDAAMRGDLVYNIEHAGLPKILRESAGIYHVVGEACLERGESGEWKQPASQVRVIGTTEVRRFEATEHTEIPSDVENLVLALNEDLSAPRAARALGRGSLAFYRF